MSTVEDVSELYADIVEEKELGPTISNNLPQATQNVWQTNIISKIMKMFTQVSSLGKSHDVKL